MDRVSGDQAAPGLEQGRSRSVEAGGILDENEAQLPAFEVDRLETTERGPKARERAQCVGEADVERASGRQRGERVVRVVKTGDRDPSPLEDAPDGARELKLGRALGEHDLRRGDVAAWPRETTRPA